MRIKALNLKRATDIVIASSALLLLFPLLLCVGIAVFFKLGWPVLYTQIRPGLGQKPFKLVKFRTMLNQCDATGKLLPDNLRLTRFGRWLRSTSLDELPELWNVIKGDMSLVGPRPLLMEYLPLYDDFQRQRYLMRPGLTGWAQINGRNTVTWEKRFVMDVWYIENYSYWLDIKILFKTLKKVLNKEGIHAHEHVTVENFKGNGG